MNQIQDVRAWNEAMVKKYDIEAYYDRSNPVIRWIERMRIRTLLKVIQNKLPGRVLEVGCGAGHVLDRLPQADLVGIDLSSHMVQRAKDRIRQKRVWILQADAECLPFQGGVFDSVICTEVLEHVVAPEKILKEIGRVAKSKAAIALSIPNEKVINRAKDMIIRLGLGSFFFGGDYKVPERMNDEWHLHVFDLKELLQRLNETFLIQKVTPIPSAFLPLRYVIACTPRG